MIVYILIFLFLILFYVASQKVKVNGNETFFVASFFIILTIFVGFRFEVGTDYPTYQEMFRTINSSLGNYVVVEPGFWLINRFIYIIGGNFQLMFLVISIITYVFFYNYFKYFSGDIFFSVFIFLTV